MSAYNVIHFGRGPVVGFGDLERLFGRGDLTEILRPLALRDLVYERFDFNLKALDATNIWNVAAGGGATTWAINTQESGVVRGVPGATAATSGLQLSLPANYKGDRNCGMEVRYKLSDISEIRLEIGFVNALPAVNTTVINSLVTPTVNTSTEVGMYVYDHATATTTTGLYTLGSGGFSAARVATTTNRPVNDTYQVVTVQVIGNQVVVFVDGVHLASSGVDKIEGGTAIIPAISIKQSDTNTSNVDLDYLAVWSERVA